MKRGMITITETGTVVVPNVPVWMTLPEIADMLGVFEYDVRKVIKSIYRNKELYEFETMKYVLLNPAQIGNLFQIGIHLLITQHWEQDILFHTFGTTCILEQGVFH